ncbi:MAG TPA: hypothetical protein VK673_11215 [Chthoniobacterales bacterium]|nr:hypothetical protein [Chthoniobacterales bacterium]
MATTDDKSGALRPTVPTPVGLASEAALHNPHLLAISQVGLIHKEKYGRTHRG